MPKWLAYDTSKVSSNLPKTGITKDISEADRGGDKCIIPPVSYQFLPVPLPEKLIGNNKDSFSATQGSEGKTGDGFENK